MGRFALTALLIAAALAAPHCAAAQTPEDGQWVMPGKNHQGFRFSGLTEITPDNVKQLKVAWTFSLGVEKGQEAAPIVAGNTMFVVAPYPNILYAIDLTKPGGAVKWKFEPKPAAAAQGVACCDVVNRGAAYADGKIFFNTLDDHTVALDADTGRELWRTKLGEITRGETMTMAPLVVKRQGAGREQRRRAGRAGLADRARREHAARSPGAPTAPAPTRTC